jgi:hypothetical protein
MCRAKCSNDQGCPQVRTFLNLFFNNNTDKKKVESVYSNL